MKRRRVLTALFLLLAVCALALGIAAVRRAQRLPSSAGILERARKNAPGTVCGCQAHACVLLHVNKKYGILGISKARVMVLQRRGCLNAAV